MAILRIDGKLAFVKGIKEATHIGLKEAKDIADEIIPSVMENNIATFDPKKFGWNEQTLKKICEIANSCNGISNVKIIEPIIKEISKVYQIWCLHKEWDGCNGVDSNYFPKEGIYDSEETAKKYLPKDVYSYGFSNQYYIKEITVIS